MKKTCILVVLVTICSLFIGQNSWAREQFVFGVHPYRKPLELKKMFTPLIQYLEKELEVKIAFRSAPNYEEAMANLMNGKVDFSYLGPAGYAILDDQHPGKLRIGAAVLNKGKHTFNGVFIVKQGSPFNSIADLKGKKIAFGDRKSTLSYYVPAYMLIQAGIFDTVSYKFLGSHDNVALAIINGLFDGGGIKPGVADKYIGKGVKVIVTSEPFHEHVVVIGPHVDMDTVTKVRTALINVQDPVVYTSIKKSLTGFDAVQPSDYDNLKELIKIVDARLGK